jgi:hypothetical protein
MKDNEEEQVQNPQAAITMILVAVSFIEEGRPSHQVTWT